MKRIIGAMTFVELVETIITWRTFAEICALIFVYKVGYGVADLEHRKQKTPETTKEAGA